MITQDRNFPQHNSGDLVCMISLLTSQLRTTSRTVAIKYLGLLVVYKIICNIGIYNCYNYVIIGNI